jgi:hypothetical protein
MPLHCYAALADLSWAVWLDSVGIVADSDENAQYRETLDKAFAMLKLLRQFGGVYGGSAQSR